MQFGPQISFCHFSQYITHARHLLHLLTFMDDHYADHCQRSCRLWKRLCQSYTTDFFIPLLPYTCCNMVKCFCSSFLHWTQNLIYIRCSVVDMCDLMPTKETNSCCYAFRGYEKAKLFIWWHHEWCQLTRQNLPSFSSYCKLYQWILGTFWSYYIFFLVCQSNLTSAHVTVIYILQMYLITILTFFIMCIVCQISCSSCSHTIPSEKIRELLA